MDEYTFLCPYCWQKISVMLELSVPEQRYVEDCEICCSPIEIHYRVEDDEVIYFNATKPE